LPETNMPAPPQYGTRLGHWFFYIILRWFGPAPAYVLLIFVVAYYVFVLRQPRRQASYYLRRRFERDGSLKRLFRTYGYIYHFGQCLIDQAAMGILGRKHFHIDFPNRGDLYELSKTKKGLVLLSSHVGNWQTAMAVVDDMAIPVNFMLRLDQRSAERYFFNLSGEAKYINIIDPTSFLGGLVEATQRLQNGECVSIMGDRAWGSRTEAVEFLGAPAFFPVTPYRLVSSTEADLVILLTARTGKLAFRIDYFHFSCNDLDCRSKNRAEISAILLNKYVKILEDYVQQYPYMWFNFFDFWSMDKNQSEAETL